MAFNHDYFNAHANQNRIFGNKGGACPAPAIKAKDEAKYSIAMEKAADNRRVKPAIKLAKAPWE